MALHHCYVIFYYVSYCNYNSKLSKNELFLQDSTPILNITLFCGDFFKFRLHINKAILSCFLEELTVTLYMLCGANTLGIIIKSRTYGHNFAVPMKKTSQSSYVIAA